MQPELPRSRTLHAKANCPVTGVFTDSVEACGQIVPGSEAARYGEPRRSHGTGQGRRGAGHEVAQRGLDPAQEVPGRGEAPSTRPDRGDDLRLRTDGGRSGPADRN